MATVEKSLFFPTIPTSTMPQKRWLKPKFGPLTYLNVSLYLRNSWLENIKRKTTTPSLSISVFAADNHLAQSLFGSSSNENKQKVVTFCNALRARAQRALSQQDLIIVSASINTCKQQIGQIVFLAEQDLEKTASFLDVENISLSLVHIETAFEREIKKALNEIEETRKQHDKVPLQDSTLAVSVCKPLAIAKLLMTSSGLLNLGLIDLIKKRFFDPSHLARYEKELLHTLDVISRSPEIQQQFQKIGKPASPHFISNDIIRISLKLPPNVAPTDHQAKVVALASLLSDLRQGEVGACFAANISILIMGALRSKVIADFDAILKQGKLSKDSFIPIFDVDDETLQHPISIDRSGKVLSGRGHLWESPGIIAACKQLGIAANHVEASVKEAISEVYRRQSLSSSELAEVTAEKFIHALAEHVKSDDPAVHQDQKTLSLIAFCAETNTLLLRAWESCLAAIAKANEESTLRKKILHCIIEPLNSLGQATDIRKVRDLFERILDAGMQMRDGEHGNIVLHELAHGSRSIAAKRVSNPEAFRSFLLNRLKITWETLKDLPEEKRKNSLQAIDKIRVLISSGQTPLFCQTAQRDPFDSETIADFIKATGFYPGQITAMRPKNAQELLENFIFFGREKAKTEHLRADEDPYQRYTPHAQRHPFTLTFDDPTIISAIKGAATAQDWILQNIIQPGLAISGLKLSSQEKNHFIGAIKAKVIPQELHSYFNELLTTLNPQQDTIHAFSNQIVRLLLSMDQKQDNAARSSIANKVTAVLLQTVLPPSAKKTLSSSAARIACTDPKNPNIPAIHFVCFFDPVSNELKLGSIREDGSELQPQNDREWTVYVPWEVHGIKLNPQLTDHKVELLSV